MQALIQEKFHLGKNLANFEISSMPTSDACDVIRISLKVMLDYNFAKSMGEGNGQELLDGARVEGIAGGNQDVLLIL